MKDVTCLQCIFFAAASTTQPRHREKKRDRQGERKTERKKSSRGRRRYRQGAACNGGHRIQGNTVTKGDVQWI